MLYWNRTVYRKPYDLFRMSAGDITTKALDEVHKASAGIPRIINRVCEKALMYAFQNQKQLIDDYMIKFVVEHEMLGMVES